MQSESRRASKRKYANSPKGRLQQSNWRRTTLRGYLHRVYRDIKRRCTDPRFEGYKYWGGRGVKDNFKSAANFADYVINVLRIDPRGLQIDRINNNGHYEPGNIRFVTAKINANNRRKRKCRTN